MVNFRLLRVRLVSGQIAMLLTIVIIGLGSYYALQNTIAAFQGVVEKSMTEMHLIQDLQHSVLQASMPANDYLIHGRKGERQNFKRLSQQVNEYFKRLLSLSTLTQKKRKLVEEAYKHWQHASALSNEILKLSRPVGNRTAALAMEHMDKILDQAINILDDVNRIGYKEVENHLGSAKQVGQQAVALLIIALVAGAVLVLISSTMFVRTIILPIRKLQDGVSRFGRGDYKFRLKVTSDDELGQLSKSFNNMANSLEQHQNELKRISTYDSLTGLLNRREIERRLDEALGTYKRYHRIFSLLLLDLDHFKQVNDTYGHQSGDELLKTFADAVQQVIRPVDLFARYGGEEFLILMPEINIESAKIMAERIRALVELLVVKTVAGKEISFTVSIGVTGVSESVQDHATIIHTVDQALYAAKEGGRNRIYCA